MGNLLNFGNFYKNLQRSYQNSISYSKIEIFNKFCPENIHPVLSKIRGNIVLFRNNILSHVRSNSKFVRLSLTYKMHKFILNKYNKTKFVVDWKCYINYKYKSTHKSFILTKCLNEIHQIIQLICIST